VIITLRESEVDCKFVSVSKNQQKLGEGERKSNEVLRISIIVFNFTTYFTRNKINNPFQDPKTAPIIFSYGFLIIALRDL